MGRCRFFCADVGRENNHRVFETHRATVTVREYAVFKDLQQKIEYVGMSLFDFIEQHHGIGLSTHLFGELSAFFKADKPRRRTDEP